MGRDSAKKLGSVILPFVIYYVVHDLSSILLAFLLGLSLRTFGEGYQEFMSIHAGSVDGALNGLALCIGALAVWPMAKKELAELCGHKDGLSKEPLSDGADSDLEYGSMAIWVKKAGMGRLALEYLVLMLCAVSLAIGMNLLLILAGVTSLSENYAEISTRQYGVGLGLGLVLYGLVSPLAEETVFRGVIYNRMKRCLRTGSAILLCGILFGIYHGNLVQGIYGCVLGLMITLVYEWYGSICAPVLFHGAANAAVFLVSYDAERFQGMVAPLYCVVFLAVSICVGLLMWKWKRQAGKDFRTRECPGIFP